VWREKPSLLASLDCVGDDAGADQIGDDAQQNLPRIGKDGLSGSIEARLPREAASGFPRESA